MMIKRTSPGMRAGAAKVTAAGLGVYAGLLGMIHGICELMQGFSPPEGLVFYAVGPPCRPDAVWHGCLPAMTVIPCLFCTGLVAVLIGVLTVIWSLLLRRKRGGLGLIILSVLMALTGGGFVAPFAGIMAGIAGMCHGKISRPGGAVKWLAKLWPWPLIIVLAWLPAGWVLGYFFNGAMLAASSALFILCDILLPVLALWTGLARDGMDRSA